jgi:aminoglycoside phosphotransferase (APT) family kinase protein
MGPGPPTTSPFLTYLCQLLDDVDVRVALGEGRASRLDALLAGRGGELPSLDGTLSHGDFKGSNILLRIDHVGIEVAALLDWEFAFAGHPLFDFAALLRFDELLPPGFEPAVVDGYRSGGGELPEGWRATVRLLDLTNMVGMLERAPAGTVMREDLRGRVDRTLEVLGWSASR